MRNARHIMITFALSVFAVCAGCGDRAEPGAEAGAGDRLLVVTSIAPIADWIRTVGGDDVEVLALVPPASSPHTFELRPGQLRTAGRASLVVLNGAGLEYWSDKLLANLDPGVRVLELAEGQDLLQEAADHDHDHDGHSHALGNPHLWLDPVFAAAAAGRIAAVLTELLPGRAAAIEKRREAFAAEIAALDMEIRERSARWSSRSYIGDHSTWVYFGRRYGIVQAGVIEATPGREASARDMAELIAFIRNNDVPAVFADRRKTGRAVEVLREATGVRVAMCDPIGSDALSSYLDLMRYNLDEMDRAMR